MEPLSLVILHGFSGVYPSVLALCLVAWVLILRRRSRFLTRRAASQTAFSKERNEIIDSFGRDESLEAILNRVCSMVDLHLPGSACRIELIREGGVTRDDSPGGLPILSASGKTVAIMRVAVPPAAPTSIALLDDIKRLTAQAIEQRRLYDRLLRQSPQSMLEGIVDRVLLEERLEAAMSRARVHGHGVALIHVALESFEDISEVLGSGAGEVVLHCAAFRLLACTRPSDHVARIGRDEFSVILTELHSRANAEEVARRIVASLDAPIGVEQANIHVGAAVGICLFPDHASDSGEMQRRAHLAMYSAKNGSTSQYAFYKDDEVESDQEMNAAPEADLNAGLDDTRATRDLLFFASAVPPAPAAFAQSSTETAGHPLNLS